MNKKKDDENNDNRENLKQLKRNSMQAEVKRNKSMFDELVKSSKANMQYMVKPKK